MSSLDPVNPVDPGLSLSRGLTGRGFQNGSRTKQRTREWQAPGSRIEAETPILDLYEDCLRLPQPVVGCLGFRAIAADQCAAAPFSSPAAYGSAGLRSVSSSSPRRQALAGLEPRLRVSRHGRRSTCLQPPIWSRLRRWSHGPAVSGHCRERAGIWRVCFSSRQRLFSHRAPRPVRESSGPVPPHRCGLLREGFAGVSRPRSCDDQLSGSRKILHHHRRGSNSATVRRLAGAPISLLG